MNNKVATMVVLPIVLLASCGSRTATTMPPSSPARTAFTATALVTPAPAPTVLPAPTATSQIVVSPSAVHTLAATPEPTLLPSRTIPPATLNALATMQPFLSDDWTGASLSHDGAWMAFVDNTSGILQQTVVVRLSDGHQWRLSYAETYGDRAESVEGKLYPYYWTADGQHLLLAARPQFDGRALFTNGSALLRLSLEAGNVVDALPSVAPGAFHQYSFSLSPDGDRLASIAEWLNPLVLDVLDMRTGDREQFPLDAAYTQAGSLAWSPAGDRLALAAALGDVTDRENGRYFIMVISVGDDPAPATELESLELLDPVVWLDENTLIVSRRWGENEYLALDLATGTLAEATASR